MVGGWWSRSVVGAVRDLPGRRALLARRDVADGVSDEGTIRLEAPRHRPVDIVGRTGTGEDHHGDVGKDAPPGWLHAVDEIHLCCRRLVTSQPSFTRRRISRSRVDGIQRE